MRYLSVTAALAAVIGLAALLTGDLPGQGAGNGQWGTIKGKVLFDGKPPAAQKINVNGNDDKKHCQEKGDIYEESWVVDTKTKGVQWVLVWLAPDPDGGEKELPIHPSLKKVSDKPVVMDQPCCKFIPHFLALREGQTWLAKNSSPAKHNVNYIGNPRYNKGENFLLQPKTERAIKGLKAQPLPMTVKCDLHRWMNARVAIFKHPYFAVTNKDGSFEIKNAPAGKFRLFVWQESIGYRNGEKGAEGEKIIIKPGVNNLGKLTIKPEE